jgi:hypothetical protein
MLFGSREALESLGACYPWGNGDATPGEQRSVKAMTTREALDRLLKSMPEDRLRELLDFAEFLRLREERDGWKLFGQAQLSRAYGPDEPEYTEADLRSELNS